MTGHQPQGGVCPDCSCFVTYGKPCPACREGPVYPLKDCPNPECPGGKRRADRICPYCGDPPEVMDGHTNAPR